MSNYLTVFFTMMFVVAFGFGMLYSGDTNLGNDDIAQEFQDKFDDDMTKSGSFNFNSLMSTIVSFETAGGAIAGFSAALLLGGSGGMIIAGTILGAFVPIAFNYYGIVTTVISTFPAPLWYIIAGLFGTMIVVMFMRFVRGG